VGDRLTLGYRPNRRAPAPRTGAGGIERRQRAANSSSRVRSSSRIRAARVLLSDHVKIVALLELEVVMLDAKRLLSKTQKLAVRSFHGAK
jgi:hypothetical protein